MVSERDEAKLAIREPVETDPELNQVLGEAGQFQIDLLKERHRHAEKLRTTELGWLGKAFGGERNAPTGIAALAMIISFTGSVICLYLAAKNPESKDFLLDWSGRTLAIGTTALGFIFGQRSS
jgi:hypothetical protein